MDQLTGANVQVVLSIKEGRGFRSFTNPTCIVATLDGQSLETVLIKADPNPSYKTDLIWKADKYSLRKMRSGQKPLKIECFEIKDPGKREKIGYVLLSLRSALIVAPRDEDTDIAATWHRLSGLRNDVKTDKPEISLALTIEEHDTYVRRMSRQEVASSKERMQRDFPMADSEAVIPRLNEKESLIQLGPEATCSSLFLLDIVASTAKNLHLLRQETFNGSGEDYTFWYRVLENDVRLKTFAALEERLELNERALIRIRSSWNVLRNYLLKQPNLLLILQRGDTILGHTEVDLSPLMDAETIQDSVRNKPNADNLLNHRCVLINETRPSSIHDNDDKQPFLDLQLSLRCIDEKEMAQQRGEGDPVERYGQEWSGDIGLGLNCAFSEIDAHKNPCGDFNKSSNKDRRIRKSLYTNTLKVGNVRNEKAIADPSGARNASKSLEAYHCYCLNVSLIGIKLSSSIRNIEFRFHHPKAEVISTLYPKMPLLRDEQLRLQDIRCKLHFISAADEISRLLLAFPLKVSIRDLGNESKAFVGQTILDVAFLLRQDKHECKYEALLYDDDKNKIGTLDVAMYFEDHGPYYKSYRSRSDENFGPPIIDDSLAYKIVDELESWKDHQQEIFLAELKRREERHLNRLSEEWQQRREKLESKLACSVEQCKILANNLNKATEDLRMRRLKSLEKEARLIKANEDLQWRYESNILQIQDASRQLQEEHESKIKSLEERKDMLETQNESLRIENERLRRSAIEQEEEIRAYQKGTLTQDQTAALLQEVKALEQKLGDTRKSKAFFKEEWGKAVREIHRMKIEHQQAIGVQIKTSKEELKNFDLEDVLCADSTALTNDQVLLGQIQKEIDVIKPSSIFLSKDASQQSLMPNDARLNSRDAAKSYRSTKSDRQDERVRKLIEERDALLKTGSYTNDDVVIVKLNTEIRSLLIVD